MARVLTTCAWAFGVSLLARLVRSQQNTSTCLPTQWKLFEDLDALTADPTWSSYYRTLYGELPSDPESFPLCTGDAWVLYDSILNQSNVTEIPDMKYECPAPQNALEGQRYATNNPFSPAGLTWSWHPSAPNNTHAPWAPFPNNTWVEVMHRGYLSDEKTGAWFYYARGSGIWINLGKTIAFESHNQAYAYFNSSNVTYPQCTVGLNVTTLQECMCHLAAAQGYDTIQMTKAAPQMCPYGKNWTTSANMNYELVSTRLQGKFACASEDGLSPLIRTGWKGNRACTCNNTNSHTKNLNCAEVPR